MKKFAILSLFIVTLLTQIGNLSAQNNSIVTTITPKVRLFPSGGFNYLDDPGRYFNIQMMNTSAEAKDIYFTISLSCDFSATGESFFVNTKKEYQPAMPITVGVGTAVQLHRNHFDQIIGNLNANAYETNVDRAKLVNNVFTLPEGQYRFCITPYQWTGHNDQNPMQLGEQVCYVFSICYSGSAPEFTSPVNGFSLSHLNNQPVRVTSTISAPNIAPYVVLPLQRNVNFSWTGVISNCLTPNDFNYTLKIVEVYKGQNIQDAIVQNPTVATIDNKTRTSYQHDTMANRHFRLQRGHVYAAQVQATLRNNLLTEVRLSNDGKSQVIAFVWGDDPVQQPDNTGANITSSVSDNRAEVKKSIREPYFVSPGKDQTTITALQTRLSGEAANVPAGSGGSFVGGEEPYYQVTPSEALPVQWMPVRGDSVFRVKYIASLYEYVGGEVANSMNVQPLRTQELELNCPGSTFDVNDTQLIDFYQEWAKDTLQEGYKYVLNLKSEVFYSYNQKTTYTITEYIHNVPSNHDSIVNEVMFANDIYESNVVFAWGIDSGALDKVYPPEFTYPVDLTEKEWDDDSWTELPDVTKRESFSFRWKSAYGVDYQDSVYYKLKIGILPKGKTPDKVKDFFFTKDSIATTEYIDTVLFDSLKVDKQYVAYVEAWIKQKEDTSAHYNILNKGVSHPATFKLVAPPEFVADLNNKIKCFPKALDELSKETITPTAESLVNDRVELKMGNFPLVMQTCQYDEEKKVYNGDGYVIWHPLGVDVRLKVKVDSIQINKDHQIIKGSAVSTATDSSLYIDALMNDIEMSEWTNDDINSVVSKMGENEKLKGYYDKFKKNGEKYAKKYGGIAGVLTGGNIQTEVLTFPLSVTDDELTGSKNVIFAINNMFFSPVTALMNIWAIFAAQSDNAYVPFLANNVCMDQQGFLGNSSTHIELFMGRDYEINLNDGYKMRFKKSSNFANPKDGTVIIVDTGKLDCMMAQIEFDMNSNDVMGIEKDGTPRKGKTVHANLYTKIKDWDDWVARITMDPFAVAGADRFTFVPTGKGIFYDHSSSESPKEITFPKDYFAAGAPEDAKPQGDNKGGKDASDKEKKEWQGFYWDELTVFLSDEISNTFVDEDLENKDSVVTYKHGINGTVEDSVHYCYPGSRINFGTRGLLIDRNGFSVDIFAQDIVRAETKSGGGWAFSLDTVCVKFVKNKYKTGIIQGKMGLPLFKGHLKYECSIGADSLEFGIHATDTILDLDLWIAKVRFDDRSSYFRIKKIYKEKNTRIDLTMNGEINVDFNKIGIPVNFTLVKFEHMGMRNYNLGKNGNGTASCDKFSFDIGDWSFASPQKTIGGLASNGAGTTESKSSKDADISFGGFSFSLTKFKPIAQIAEKGKLKLGFDIAGQMKFDTEDCDLGAECGFSVWGIVDPANKFHIVDVGHKLNSINFDDIDFTVFKLNGKLDFYDKTAHPEMGDGFGGSLSVSMMSVVTLKMNVGFGNKKENGSNYRWWYFDGACKFSPGIPLGTVSINGFSGGFAYNMKPKYSLTDDRYSAAGLLKTSEKNTDQEKVCTSGMEFVPAKNNWVANAGISLALTGAENTLNADGLISLRMANKHFSGIFIDANAYVVSTMDKAITPGDGKNNKSPLAHAKAIIGFEKTKEYDFFRLSIAAKSSFDLSDLLDGLGTSELKSSKTLTVSHTGASLSTNSNLNTELDNLKKENGLGSHDANQREDAANASTNTNNKTFTFSTSVSIPIDFELKYYKKAVGSHKAGATEWYFAIGKPDYDKRVRVSENLDVKIYKSKSEFTFYLQTGNAFAYQMPQMSSDLQKFFTSTSGKKIDADNNEIKNARKINSNDWLTIDKGGGFCLGATFHSSVEYYAFLYFSGSVDLGFDVALLDVKGKGCPGHSQLGKNNFYAMGQIYAALQCAVGLKINLGFWKGNFTLFKSGVGALLQGGGPNPSYAYGLLRFKVNMLNGLLKFSTSVDFKVGDVCVPEIGDPLANVNLFQSVTPGFATETEAQKSCNLQSSLQMGTIVSNMPWDKEVYLTDEKGSTARRFYFTFIDSKAKHEIRKGSAKNYSTTTGGQTLQFTPSSKDENTIFFETQTGGFVPNADSKLTLQARAFEWRKKAASSYSIKNPGGQDLPYYVSGVNKGKTKSSAGTSYDWYDPTFYDDATKKYYVDDFTKDTVLYFKTNPLGESLEGNVVFSWPYNGDRVFPSKEYVTIRKSALIIPNAMLYLYSDRSDIFDKDKLSKNGKTLKIFLLKYKGEAGDAEECSYAYYNDGSVPYVKVHLPKKEYGSNGYGPHKLRFIIVDNNAYDEAVSKANDAISVTTKKAEYSSRISNSVYTQAQDAHNAIVAGKGGWSYTNWLGFKQTNTANTEIDIQNQQLDEIYQSKKDDGKDSMTYYRIKMNASYKAASSVGNCIYEWTWFVDYNYETYGEYFARTFSNSCTPAQYANGTNIDYKKLSSDLSSKNATVYSSYNSLSFSSNKNYWLFLPYDPNDAKRYNTSCELPPRFFMTLTDGGDANLSNMYNQYFSNFLSMESSFKTTPFMEKRYSKKDEDDELTFSSTGNTTVSDASLTTELKRILAGGFKAGTTKFPHIELRLQGYSLSRCKSAGYHPTSVDYPCLLEISSSQQIQPMSETYFSQNYSGCSIGQGTSTYSITITDYATHTMVDDIKMFHDFKQKCQQHARAFDNRGWSHKTSYFQSYYSSTYKNSYFAPDGFPFEIPEIYLVTHYMTVLDDVGRLTEYTLRDGTSININHGKERYFLTAGDLPDKDKWWSFYWWSAFGQPTNTGPQGFARDFYTESSTAKYYNYRHNQNNEGFSTTKANMLGRWYSSSTFTVPSQLTNKVRVLFLSAEGDNFEDNLMKIAKAVKTKEYPASQIFYPNTAVYPGSTYTVKLSGTTLQTKLNNSKCIQYMDNDDGTALKKTISK